MITYYDILDKLKTILISDNDVNTVTRGSLDDVALNKYTSYPLSHIIVNNVDLVSNGIHRYNISVIAMDIVDLTKSANANLEDIAFRGIDNEDDVLNTQLAVLTRLAEVLRKGDAYLDGYYLNGDPSCEPFTERFQDNVAGWVLTFNLDVYHDMTICS